MTKYNKILVLGAGPVKIGQSIEFDYSAYQVCRALKEEGAEVIFANSTPTSVATDKDYADRVYIEPLNIESVKRILKKEKPDALIGTAGGDATLELCLELSQNGYLDETNTALLGVEQDALTSIKNRHSFTEFLKFLNEPSVDALVVNSVSEAVDFANEAGYPVIVRPAFTPDVKSAEYCANEEELVQKAGTDIENSVVSQVLIEKSIAGWKELEVELLRDESGESFVVAIAENLDPVGIHTGDSFSAVPAQTLSEEQKDIISNAAMRIVNGFNIVGSCNVQLAFDKKTNSYVVTGVDPRVSRTSALISKATGCRIAYLGAKLMVGESLSRIPKLNTQFNGCAVKLPKWSFDNLSVEDRKLGTLMQATGESMAYSNDFVTAFMKGIRGNYEYIDCIKELKRLDDKQLLSFVKKSDDKRIFAVYEALFRGYSQEELNEITGIDIWFLNEISKIAKMEKTLRESYSTDLYSKARAMGFSHKAIEEITEKELADSIEVAYDCVKRAGTERDDSAFCYSSFSGKIQPESDTVKNRVLVVGSGATSTSMGGDNDYCLVHCIKSLKSKGYEVICVNNNPASVTTDYDIADRVYIEPLTCEDILNIIKFEKPEYAVLMFGSEKVMKYSQKIEASGVKLLGVDYELYRKLANKFELFDILDDANVKHTSSRGVFVGTCLEAFVVSDGEDFTIPAVCEHIEKAHINSGDSISVCPVVSVDDSTLGVLQAYVKNIIKEISFKGVLNMQFVIFNNDLYVTKVSAAETSLLPFVNKASGIDVVALAVDCMTGKSLKDMGISNEMPVNNGKFFVRVPVFSFDKLKGADMLLGDKTKSTGDVMGVGDTFDNALLKGLIAAGMRVKRTGSVLVSVRESDKSGTFKMADEFLSQGFKIYATSDTAKLLNSNHIASSTTNGEKAIELINSNKFAYIVSTLDNGRNKEENHLIRKTALLKKVPVFTSVESAYTFACSLANNNVMEELEVTEI